MAFQLLRDSLGSVILFFLLAQGINQQTPAVSVKVRSLLSSPRYIPDFFGFFSSRFFIFQVGLLGIGILNSLNVNPTETY